MLSLLAACGAPGGNTAFAPGGQKSSGGASKDSFHFTYQTINDPGSSTLTEILGVNNLGKICGFYNDPNVGMTARSPYQAQNFQKVSYPGAVDTQVAAINNSRTVAGWYDNSDGQIFGFTEWEGIWTNYQDPHAHGGSTQVTELLGIEDDGLAVGYYEDSTKVLHPFEIDTTTGQYHNIDVPGAVDSVATGINGKGDIVGWLTLASGVTEGWLLKGGFFTLFAYPASQQTRPTSINWTDDIAGSYQDRSGDTHGFVLSNPLTSQLFQKIDEPDAGSGTVVTGINNHHAIVGYYSDGSGNTNGFLGTAATR